MARERRSVAASRFCSAHQRSSDRNAPILAHGSKPKCRAPLDERKQHEDHDCGGVGVGVAERDVAYTYENDGPRFWHSDLASDTESVGIRHRPETIPVAIHGVW